MNFIRLIDRTGNIVATANVTDEGDYFGGSIDLRPTPAELRALFAEFEAVVNGQEFGELDELQEKIEAVRIRIAFADGSDAEITDLQIYPATGGVSFRLVKVLSAAIP